MTARTRPGRRVLWAGALVPWLVGALVWAVVQVVSSPSPSGPAPDPAGRAADPAGRAIGSGAEQDVRIPSTQVARAVGVPDWVAVLDRLDRRRELAYAAADPARLRDVYVAGSPVLRHDLAMLRAYRERGVRLTGVRLRALDVRLLGRTGPYVRLRVVDRLGRPTAYTAEASVRLPRDQATPRVIVLRDSAAGWRIAAVRRVSV